MRSKNRKRRIMALVLCFAVCLTANPVWNQHADASAGLTRETIKGESGNNTEERNDTEDKGTWELNTALETEMALVQKNQPSDTESEPKSKPETESQVNTEWGSQADSELKSEPETESQVQTEWGSQADSEPESRPETESQIQTEGESEPEIESGEQSKSESEFESESQSESQSQPESQSESEISDSDQGMPKLDIRDFNPASIQAAGIKDQNFAQAIYDSIIADPANFLDGNTLEKNNFSTVVDLLKSYTGTIYASNKDISDIEGISLLKSCEKWDISNNHIVDIRPLSISKAVIESEVTPEEQTYYGIFGRSMEVNVYGNPIRKYPLWVGGRFNLQPLLTDNVVKLDDEVLKYVTDGTDTFEGTYTVPLSFYAGDDHVNIREDSIKIREVDAVSTGAQVSQQGGKIESLQLTNILGSGKLFITLGAANDSRMNWFVITDSGFDDVQSNASTISWRIPFEVKVYTKVEKGTVQTTHKITLVKTGQDDGKPKEGAKYVLYRKQGDDLDPKADIVIGSYITDENGKIEVEGLEVGDYYFLEESPPDGYDKNPLPTNFSVRDGELKINGKSGSEIDTGELQGVQEIEDGSFVLGGDGTDNIDLEIIPPQGGDLESLTLKWTAGNHNGSAGMVTYIVGSGESADPATVYVPDRKAAEAAAEAKLAEARDLYQNVSVAAAFTQHLEAEQQDPLYPIVVSLEVLKKLKYPTGKEITPVPEGMFVFSLENDPAYPETPTLPSTLTAVNESDGTAKFETITLGSEITQDTVKDGGNYIYHYRITEKDNGDPNYIYDGNVYTAAVAIGKAEGTDRLEVKSITYTSTDGTSNNEYAVFVNTLIAVPFQFYKVDGNDHNKPLSNVKFTLYSCQSDHQQDDQHDELVTNDPGNCWIQRDTVVSGENGLVDFANVPSGDYQLVEVETNPGYSLPFGQWRIHVDVTDKENPITIKAAGDPLPPAFIKEVQGDKIIYKLPNFKKADLPLAGGSGTWIFSTGGVGVIMLAIFLLVFTGGKPKKKRRIKVMKKIINKLSAVFMAAVITAGMFAGSAAAAGNNTDLPEEKGSLTIHKYLMDDISQADTPGNGNETTDIPESAIPLNGIEFKVEKLKITLDADGNAVSPTGGKIPTNASEVTEDMIDKDSAKTVTTSGTDAAGKDLGIAVISDLDRGFYYVTELPSEKVAEPVAPFIVSVPMTNPEGTGWITDVHVYPKNESASIDKYVTKVPNKHETSDTHGGKVTWIIQPSIPTNVAAAKKYDITDKLDDVLKYVADSIKVYGVKDRSTESGSAGEVLIPAGNYDTAGTTDSNVKVSFTQAGRQHLADSGYKFIRVVFETTLTKEAPMQTEIKNGAKLDYKNQFDQDKSYEVLPEDKPEVHTGKIGIVKVDANNQAVKLPDAKFAIAASLSDAKNKTYIKDTDGNDIIVTTKADGTAEFLGFSYGKTGDKVTEDTKPTTYYLVETQAPNGYNLLNEPVKVSIDTAGIEDTGYIAQVTVKNSSAFILPITGGMGTTIFTVAGIGFIILAGILLIHSFKKRKVNQ
ncbi:SpaH/EbpB family LPXTG-anchored major pilin [uncultured Robinsoniella sp.]|uniref:SpaH/EbpB family LPXTG-anchored major pilin n=1 Tax=uncultured Robinsoniella sp. TaxID=904190 RepID=UPI00374F89A9